MIRYLTEDHDRIAQRMNDVVVRRIFAAGLDLQAGLGLIGDHRGASKTYHALDELDQAIRDIRDTIFDRSPPDSPCLSYEGARRTALYTNPRESGANEFPAPRGSSHSWRRTARLALLPEELDAGDSEPEEPSPAGLLRRAESPYGHARRDRHPAEDPLLL